MAGIYIHIPFCKQACHYCNFHFSTNRKSINDFVEALLTEIKLRSEEWKTESIDTLYFGGGTPSQLSIQQLELIMTALSKHYLTSSLKEITYECNPDDLSVDYLKGLKRTGISRLSIGVQSFHDKHLIMMNRSHKSEQATNAVSSAQGIGFKNISIDLIYGLPYLSLEEWNHNLELAAKLQVPHLSCYSLTVEERTALAHFVKQKIMKPAEDDLSVGQYQALLKWSAQTGIQQYEISNFAKPGFESQHNSSYWKGIPYLGLGPSAHTYIHKKRFYNPANNARYIKELLAGKLPKTSIELLSDKDVFNEFIMTRLRTVNGIHLDELHQFSNEFVNYFNLTYPALVQQDLIQVKDGNFQLTTEGQMLSDHVMSALFIVD